MVEARAAGGKALTTAVTEINNHRTILQAVLDEIDQVTAEYNGLLAKHRDLRERQQIGQWPEKNVASAKGHQVNDLNGL